MKRQIEARLTELERKLAPKKKLRIRIVAEKNALNLNTEDSGRIIEVEI